MAPLSDSSRRDHRLREAVPRAGQPRRALLLCAPHTGVRRVLAWINLGRGPVVAALLSAAVFAGPAIAHQTVRNPRFNSVVHGITAMFMGGLLVHFGQGPVQIEMHFYFFSLVAMCAVFGNPLVILAAAVTVALHHLVVWLVLPRSVFNYDASWWVVAVHAAFVVLESVASCVIARSFFDNVIGLDRIVQARTAALDAKNREMRLLLDNVEQGFLTVDHEGRLAQERSAAVDRWFLAPAAGATWFDYLSTLSPEFAAQSRVAWQEVVDDVMPVELTLEQMPRRFALGPHAHYRIDYRPIESAVPSPSSVPRRSSPTVSRRTSNGSSPSKKRTERIALFQRLLVDRRRIRDLLRGRRCRSSTYSRTSARRTSHTIHRADPHAQGAALCLYGLKKPRHDVPRPRDVHRAGGEGHRRKHLTGSSKNGGTDSRPTGMHSSEAVLRPSSSTTTSTRGSRPPSAPGSPRGTCFCGYGL